MTSVLLRSKERLTHSHNDRSHGHNLHSGHMEHDHSSLVHSGQDLEADSGRVCRAFDLDTCAAVMND